jgi:hypothetical protein
MRLKYRLAVIKKFILSQFGSLGEIHRIDSGKPGSGRRVTLIAPGEIRMPVSGWGAVEAIVWNQAAFLSAKGFTVQILNSWKMSHWLMVLAFRPSLIVCHYDVFAGMAASLAKAAKTKLVTVSHYAYAAFPEKWDPGFSVAFNRCIQADVFVALSPQIQAQARSLVARAEIHVIPNGVRVEDITYSEKPGQGFIYLGKVENRKRQVAVAQGLSLEATAEVTFVGPISDPDVENLRGDLRLRFVGPWDKSRIKAQLTGFSSLILVSEAEADAMVLHEARLAGLKILVTRSALGSISPLAPGVFLVADDLSDLEDVMNHSLSYEARAEIRRSALDFSTMDAVSQKWLDLVDGQIGQF